MDILFKRAGERVNCQKKKTYLEYVRVRMNSVIIY